MTTNKQKYNKKVNQKLNQSNSIVQIQKKTGLPMKILQQIYNRGIGAHKTNLSSVRLKKDFSKNRNLKKYPKSARLSAEQWAYARLYGFLMKNPKQIYGPDGDLFDDVKNYKWFSISLV